MQAFSSAIRRTFVQYFTRCQLTARSRGPTATAGLLVYICICCFIISKDSAIWVLSLYTVANNFTLTYFVGMIAMRFNGRCGSKDITRGQRNLTKGRIVAVKPNRKYFSPWSLGFLYEVANHCATTPPSEPAVGYIPKQSFAMLIATFQLFKMAAVRHLGFVQRLFGPLTKSTWWCLWLCKMWLKSTKQFWEYASFLIVLFWLENAYSRYQIGGFERTWPHKLAAMSTKP